MHHPAETSSSSQSWQLCRESRPLRLWVKRTNALRASEGAPIGHEWSTNGAILAIWGHMGAQGHMCHQQNSAIVEQESMVIGLDERGDHLTLPGLSQHVTAKCRTLLCKPHCRLTIGHLHLKVTSKAWRNTLPACLSASGKGLHAGIQVRKHQQVDINSHARR